MFNIEAFIKKSVKRFLKIGKPEESRKITPEEKSQIILKRNLFISQKTRRIEEFVNTDYWKNIIEPYYERELCRCIGGLLREEILQKSEQEIKAIIVSARCCLNFLSYLNLSIAQGKSIETPEREKSTKYRKYESIRR